jgi:hypothetical protein
MSLAEMIYQHSLNLPEAAAQEALDFIHFSQVNMTLNRIQQCNGKK